jgi:hypothetical protein
VREGLGTVYASALAGLWGELSATLTRLERIAAEPEVELEDSADLLPALQYSLHRASELAIGLDPPSGAETAHAELAAALADARDVTAEVTDALETSGAESATLLVHEWRGALFRVRLARHRLAERPRPQHIPSGHGAFPKAALVATVLAVVGATMFMAGAMLASWPVWVAGLLAVGAGMLSYRV